MKRNLSLIPVLLVACLGLSGIANAKTNHRYADSTPVTADAKTIVSDYIKAIGGMDAVKKVNSTNASGNMSVQGMDIPVVQKRMVPNKTLQLVSMNGTTVGKTVFNGIKGYQEQMGNRTDMDDSDMIDLKAQTAIVPQIDYLTNSNYKISVQGTGKVNDATAYKLLVTTPSGKVDTEYYDMTTKLLLKQVLTKNVSGQNVVVANSFSDYRKAGDILLPYKQTLNLNAGAMSQSVDIILSDIKVNEGVADTDFE